MLLAGPTRAHQCLRRTAQRRLAPRLDGARCEHRLGVDLPTVTALQEPGRRVQFQLIADDPCERRTDAGARVPAPAAEKVPVGGAVARIGTRSHGAFRGTALRIGRGIRVVRIHPHQRGGGLRTIAFGFEQRPSLLRQRKQGASHFLLHHVVRPKPVADVPGHDFSPGTRLPVTEIARGKSFDETRVGARHMRVAQGTSLGVDDRCRGDRRAPCGNTWRTPRAAQFSFGHGMARRMGGNAGCPCVRVGDRPTGIGLAEVVAQAQLDTRSITVHAGLRHGELPSQREHQAHRDAATRQYRAPRHAYSSAGLRARNIGFSQASGTDFARLDT